MFASTEWLNNIKEGDRVCVRYGWNGMAIVKVTHATKTQIEVAGYGKFRRKSGSQVGSSSFNSSNIHEVTQEVLNELKEKKLRYRAEKVEWSKLPLDVLEKILALVPEDTEEKQT